MIQINTVAPAKRESLLFGWICKKIKQHKIRKNREAIRRRIAERKARREEMKRAFWGL